MENEDLCWKLIEGYTIALELGRSRSAWLTHRMFLDAMIADRLKPWRRTLYYGVVNRWGPQW